MRTTVNLSSDVVQAVEQYRHERKMGLSETINELVRRGLDSDPVDHHYTHPTRDMGARVDLSNVADVLELLDDMVPETLPRRQGTACAS